MNAEGTLDIRFTGDLVLDEPDAGYWLSGIAPALREADLAIGHLEVPHTDAIAELAGDVPAPGAPLENLAALAPAGFAMVSLAGNHIADCGAEGIADTCAALLAQGIAFAGAGTDLAQAREPAHVTCKGRRIALLSYNCVGPEAGWASKGRAGSNYLRIATADGSAIAPAAPLQTATEDALDTLRGDVAAARDGADIVIVALHKGLVHTPAKLAPYERPLSHAAIDAGADVVVGHHAHIVRGIEFHRGRPIFHGLGNGCVVTRALSPDQDHPARAEWARRRQEMFGFVPDPAYTLAPFHPEAVNGFIGRAVFQADGGIETGIIPIDVVPPGRPTLARDARADEVRAYAAAITVRGGLPPIAVDAAGRVVAA